MLGPLSASVTSDPTAFYSGVAAVASSFVAFLGGFFVLRLQTYAQEWRDLRLEIDRLLRVEDKTRKAIEPLDGHEHPIPSSDSSVLNEVKRRNEEALRSLAPLLHRRESAGFPFEILVQFILLTVLTLLGVWTPLLLLPAPGQHEKVVLLGPVVALVMVLWLVMIGVAWLALRSLKKDFGGRPVPFLGSGESPMWEDLRR